LVDAREETYFWILAAFSALVWLVVALTCFGIFYVAMIAGFLWLGHGLLVARLRAEGVELTPNQAPEIHAALREVCLALGYREVPRLFVLQEGGALNAFTTRHLSRSFIVIYSEMLQACGGDSPELRFILGHEIGHLHRRHIAKDLLVLPGRILPLIGNAYSRACERTCDNYGSAASGDREKAVRAMMMLAAGPAHGRTLSPGLFAAQYEGDRGFFVSWYELTSSYPTLSHRVANLLAAAAGRPAPRSARNPLAYLFALFTLSGPGGGFTSFLLTVAIVAMLMAVAIPSIEKAESRAEAAAARAAEQAEEDRRAAEVLATGTTTESFAGEWTGRSNAAGENLHWTTTRSPDGSLVTHFTQETSQGAPKKWSQRGQWRIVGDLYHEILDGERDAAYFFEIRTPDEIRFRPDANDLESGFTEQRAK